MPRHKWPEWQRRRIAADQGWRCTGGKELLDFAFQIDHIRPLGAGGADELFNLQALCGCCHNMKSLEELASTRRFQRGRSACPRCGAIYSGYFRHRCSP